MNNVRKQSKLLAALLALLMVLSVVVALPAAAEEGEVSKVVLWNKDLSEVANIKAGTDSTKKQALVDALKDYFGVASAVGSNGAASATSNISTNARVENGMFCSGGKDTVLVGLNQGGLYDLLSGTFYKDGDQVQDYFLEFDYMLGTSLSAGERSADATVDGEKVKVCSAYSEGGGGYQLRVHSGSGSNYVFRVSNNGYVYAGSLVGKVTNTATGTDGFLYYEKDITGDGTKEKIYFDAKGYRYATVDSSACVTIRDGKYYLDDPTGDPPAVSGLSITDGISPNKVNSAYQLTKGTTYRMRIKIHAGAPSSGNVSIGYDVYVREASSTGPWNYVGSSTQTSKTAASNTQKITFSGTNYTYFGGNMIAYTYEGGTTCPEGKHLEGMVATETKISDDGVTYQHKVCMACERLDEVSVDGVVYTGTTVGVACTLGKYTLWTAKDGSGATFKTDSQTAEHNYNSAGYCSGCGDFSWYSFPMSADGTYIGRSTDGKDYNNDGTKVQPTYTTANGYVDAPDSNMIMRVVPSEYLLDPYVFSLDFYVDETLANPFVAEDNNTVWTLLAYRTSGGNTTYGNLLGVAINTDENGDATGIPYLTAGLSRSQKMCDLEYDTWYNIQVVCDPVSYYCAIYVNGEYMDAIKNVNCHANATSAAIAVGLVNYSGPHAFAYRVKNLAYTPVTLDTLFGSADASNTIFKLTYDDGLEANSALKGINEGTIGSFSGNLTSATETVEIKNGYAILNTKDWYPQFAVSHNSGENEFTLSNKKYEIKLEFAVPNTDATGAVNEDGVKAEGKDGKIDALQYTYDGKNQDSQQLVRLSKYNDDIQSVLVSYKNTGTLTAKSLDLYNNQGILIDITCDFNEDGTPTSTTDLRVVVDEKNNVYSIYVNNEVAYYKEGNVYKPFFNMTMPFSKGKVTDEVSSYGEITKQMAQNAKYTGTYHYCRVLRNMWGVAVKEISLSIIPDSKAELIGVQVRNADSNATEGTFDLRFLFGLDDLYVHETGYKVKAYKNGVAYENEITRQTNVVYKAVNAGIGGAFHAYETAAGDFISALVITGIEEVTAATRYTFEIQTYTIANSQAKPVCGDVIYVISCNGLGRDITVSSRAAE